MAAAATEKPVTDFDGINQYLMLFQIKETEH